MLLKLLLLCGFLLLCPFLLGQGFCEICAAIQKKKFSLPERFVSGVLLLLILCGFSHILSVFTGRNLEFCTRLFGISLIITCSLSYLAFMILTVLARLRQAADADAVPKTSGNKVYALYLITAGIILLQILLIVSGIFLDLTGDQTAETVSSFLYSGEFYSLDPLTGLPYETDLPMRLKILGLPTFYAILCSVFQLPLTLVVFRVMPVYFLLTGYLAFGVLGRSLFPDSSRGRSTFLFLISLLVFASSAASGTDGFALLHTGFREIALRSWILLPLLLTCLKEKKYFLLLLPTLAEAMLCYSLAGTGICVLYILYALGATYFSARRARKEAKP